jgi:hypothetical protein
MGSGSSEYRMERLTRGNLDLNLDAATGLWILSWRPHYGEPDWPGHTYSPGDKDLPSDFPAPDDVEALLAWGRSHFGP